MPAKSSANLLLLLSMLLAPVSASGQILGTALQFDGNDYVQIDDDASLRPTDVTIEGWFSFDNTSGVQLLIDKHVGTGVQDSYEMWFESGSLYGVVGNASNFGPFLSAPFVPAIGQWYHLAYAFDDAANMQYLFIDGAQVATGAVNVSMGFDSEPLLIGASNDGQTPGLFFSGAADEVRIWSTARTEAQVSANMNAVLSGSETNLAAYWRFEEGSAQSAGDLTTNANTGRLGSTTGSDLNDPDWIQIAAAVPSLGPYFLTLLVMALLAVGSTRASRGRRPTRACS